MTARFWPETLWPASVMFDIEGQSESGGKSQTGFEQVTIGSAGRVVASLSFGKLNYSRPREILAAQAIKAHMRGRANTVLIGPYQAPLGPAGLLGDLGPFDVLFDDDTLFDDETGFDQPPTPASAAADFAMGGIELTVRMEADHQPQPGQWFGLKDKEIYLIEAATNITGAYWRLSFGPTLRRDVVSGEGVNFDTPTCEMRSQSDLFGQLDFRKMFETDFKIDLVEAPP